MNALVNLNVKVKSSFYVFRFFREFFPISLIHYVKKRKNQAFIERIISILKKYSSN